MTKRPKMTKESVTKFGSVYIYHRYIYISRPPPRGTDRQMYRLSIERIISISIYSDRAVDLPWGRGTDRGQSDRQTDGWIIEILI